MSPLIRYEIGDDRQDADHQAKCVAVTEACGTTFYTAGEGCQKHTHYARKEQSVRIVKVKAEHTESDAKADDRHVEGNVVKRNVRKNPRDNFVSVSKDISVEIQRLP